MTELTDKTKAIITRNLGNIYINDKQAKSIQEAIVGGEKYIILEGDLIMTSDIVAVCGADKVVDQDRIKHGDYKCKYGFWHEKNMKCAHGEL